jgi:hypothetical protein
VTQETTRARREVGTILAALFAFMIFGDSWVPWLRVVIPLVLVVGLATAAIFGGPAWVAGGLGSTLVGSAATAGYRRLRKCRREKKLASAT